MIPLGLSGDIHDKLTVLLVMLTTISDVGAVGAVGKYAQTLLNTYIISIDKYILCSKIKTSMLSYCIKDTINASAHNININTSVLLLLAVSTFLTRKLQVCLIFLVENMVRDNTCEFGASMMELRKYTAILGTITGFMKSRYRIS